MQHQLPEGSRPALAQPGIQDTSPGAARTPGFSARPQDLGLCHPAPHFPLCYGAACGRTWLGGTPLPVSGPLSPLGQEKSKLARAPAPGLPQPWLQARAPTAGAGHAPRSTLFPHHAPGTGAPSQSLRLPPPTNLSAKPGQSSQASGLPWGASHGGLDPGPGQRWKQGNGGITQGQRPQVLRRDQGKGVPTHSLRPKPPKHRGKGRDGQVVAAWNFLSSLQPPPARGHYLPACGVVAAALHPRASCISEQGKGRAWYVAEKGASVRQEPTSEPPQSPQEAPRLPPQKTRSCSRPSPCRARRALLP